VKKLLLCFIIITFSCNKQLVMNCNSNNYITSNIHNYNHDFKYSQRQISTKLSLIDLSSIYHDTGLSCLDVLLNHFYSNVCYNNDMNYIVSYSGNKINLDNFTDPILFTDRVISIISNMEMGSFEYNSFINL